MMPSGLSGVTYKLKDDQGRKYQTADFIIGVGDEGLKSTDGILPGQTRESMIIGVFDVMPSATGLELGVNDGLFSDIKYVSPSSPQSQQTAAPSPQLIAASTTVSASAPSTTVAAVPNFDLLSPCDQLDSVAKSGKSVSEFLVAAARVNDLAKYQVAIGSVCPWNAEQLQVADRVLNPPVVVVKPKVVWQPSSSSGGSSSGSNTALTRQPAPSSGWNNCNGIQEAGESYSANCHRSQVLNDAGLGTPQTRKSDERQWDMPANGYNSP